MSISPKDFPLFRNIVLYLTVIWRQDCGRTVRREDFQPDSLIRIDNRM